ncbi:hypothetical protein M0R45_007965 [Rubus argutus]|uniref:Uncharacterized protein n=1 Tax=Rubus argutus TaxID=59490 RepID=A0AAW1Y0Q7_RUBAR
MSHSRISRLEERFKRLVNLKSMNFNIYQLQNLKEVYLDACPKLVTFPNKVNFVELTPTGTKEDIEFNIGLNEFKVSGCSSLSDTDLTDFLESFDCASTLDSLNLSGSKIVSLSECLCKYICLRKLDLGGCWNLIEVPQLPPCIKRLDVRDCVSLERISNLSKILEGEESQMIEEMNLSNCCRLIENLVKEANILVNDDCQAAEALFPLFLSCQQSKFTVIFPGSKIPKWFSCQMKFKGLPRFEFVIEMIENFKWENTGLALCVGVDQMGGGRFEVLIHINEVCVSHLFTHVNSKDLSAESFSFESCGVHLVMPPNEDVCMKLSRAENITSDLLEDILKSHSLGSRIISTDAQVENQEM